MRVLAFLFVVSVASPARADELALWTELGVKREFASRFAITFEQHLRFDEDITRVAAVMPETAVHVQASRFRASAGYRLEYERDGDGELVLRHRFHAAVRSRVTLGAVRIDHRLQAQEQLYPASMDRLRHGVRNRVEVSYRGLARWTFAGSAEVFHQIGDGDAIYLDKTRLTIGAGHRQHGRETGVFYRLELPHHDADDPFVHIFGAAFHVDL